MTISAYHSRETAVNAGLGVSFDNVGLEVRIKKMVYDWLFLRIIPGNASLVNM
jgi:hypothetical protein